MTSELAGCYLVRDNNTLVSPTITLAALGYIKHPLPPGLFFLLSSSSSISTHRTQHHPQAPAHTPALVNSPTLPPTMANASPADMATILELLKKLSTKQEKLAEQASRSLGASNPRLKHSPRRRRTRRPRVGSTQSRAAWPGHSTTYRPEGYVHTALRRCRATPQ